MARPDRVTLDRRDSANGRPGRAPLNRWRPRGTRDGAQDAALETDIGAAARPEDAPILPLLVGSGRIELP